MIGTRRVSYRPGLRTYRRAVDELVDSAPLSTDPAALRERLARDGYLFFRGLLPMGPVTDAGAAVLSALRVGGWVDRSGAPSRGLRALDTTDIRADPAYRRALLSQEFQRIPYLAVLRAVVRRLLGATAFSYPVKVLRAVYPETPPSIARGRYVHQDFAVAAVADMLTTWIPLINVPVQLGGLALEPGSHLGAPAPPRPVELTQPRWATADYRIGDVLLFHCLTSHAALPNHGDRVRLSQDCRWQSPDELAPSELILRPSGRTVELYSRLLRRQPWWEPTPATVALAPREQRSRRSPRSRFFPVHSGWSQPRPRPEQFR